MKRGIVTRVRKQMKTAAASSSAHLDHEYPAAVSALEVKRLQERVNHLAVEVFHLTTELDEVRHLLSTLVAEAAVPPSQPSPPAAATIPEGRFPSYPLTSASNLFHQNVLRLSSHGRARVRPWSRQRPKALFMTVWCPDSRSVESNCGIPRG